MRSPRPSVRSPTASPARSAPPPPSAPWPAPWSPDMVDAATPTVPDWARRAALGLSLLAVGLAGYLTVTHYTDPTALACPDQGVVNCTLVTTSSWSAIGGVPVALLGLLWALAMTGLTLP